MELIDALKMIRDECRKHSDEEDCAKCPMRDLVDACFLDNDMVAPYEWEFAEDVPPRIFK